MECVVIAGTRPECIKLGPVVAALRDQGTDPAILLTGQHTDLLHGTPADTDLAFAENLRFPSDGGVTRYLRLAQARLATWLTRHDTPTVVVQGDTMSAYAGALAAAETGCQLIHVEAGIRSGREDEPFPEERFRREITQLADLHLAPTSTNYANLLAEGILPQAIRVTGNPVISALHRYADPVPKAPTRTVVVTLHRRELTDRQDFRAIMETLLQAMADHPQIRFLWPVHPRVGQVHHLTPGNVDLFPPTPYRTFISWIARAQAILTDSGGLCEEAAALGVPTIVFRNVTDRPEAVEAQIARVIPPDIETARLAVATAADPWITRLPQPIFGDQTSADQCAHAITHFLGVP